MKQLFSVLLLVTFFLSTSSFTNKLNKNQFLEKSKIEVVFNRQTGFVELVMIKADLEKKHIILNYKKIEFDNKGELIALSFSVDCQDGFSGSASTQELKNDVPFGFYRDYSKDTKSPFGTGGLLN
ncbi:MAG: hypothetical protein ABIN48_10035 [Ginsengibacter sp.]